MFLFACPKRNQKGTRGPLPVSTMPAVVLTVIAPWTPVTGVCPFGWLVSSGGLSFDRAHSYSRPTGAFCHPNLMVLVF